ncbi:MAG: flagellar FliJ family protein [Campylobacterales bacterium]|nr:flagellar FliJ family protein [Campylobacterales bacterium]
MKTRYTPLVKIKKNLFDTSERRLAEANARHKAASAALEEALHELQRFTQISCGTMAQMLQQRTLLSAAREQIEMLRHAVVRSEVEVAQAKAVLRQHLQTYEKFKYLEARETQTLLVNAKHKEQKELDAYAIDAYMYRKEQR